MPTRSFSTRTTLNSFRLESIFIQLNWLTHFFLYTFLTFFDCNSDCAKRALEDMCSWLNNEGEVAVSSFGTFIIFIFWLNDIKTFFSFRYLTQRIRRANAASSSMTIAPKTIVFVYFLLKAFAMVSDVIVWFEFSTKKFFNFFFFKTQKWLRQMCAKWKSIRPTTRM